MAFLSKKQFLNEYGNEVASDSELSCLFKYLIDNAKQFKVKGKYNYEKYEWYKEVLFEASYETTNFDKKVMDGFPYECLAYSLWDEYIIRYKESLNLKKVEVLINRYNAVYYTPSSKKVYPRCTSKLGPKFIKLIIFEDLSVYRESSKDKLIPCDLRYLSQILFNREPSMFNECIFHVLGFFSNKHMLFKDVLSELKNCPIPISISINKIFDYNTKKALIGAHCPGVKLSKKFNSFSLYFGYLLAKSKRYVNPDDWQKLYVLKDVFNKYIVTSFTRITIYEQIRELFKIYYKYCLTTEDVTDSNYIIDDYVYMIWRYTTPKKFNLKIKSYNAIKREHDDIVLRANNKNTPALKIPKNSKFKNVNLPENFEHIKTKKRLILESQIQRHCVATYAYLINEDKCSIYSTIYKDKRYTIEIRKSRNKYYIAQIKGMFNSDAPTELIELINSKLNNKISK